MGRLDNRVALLTGGAKGIGVHYAKKLAGEGARLMIADVSDAKDLAADIARQHGANSVASSVADVSDEGQSLRMANGNRADRRLIQHDEISSAAP